MPKWRKNGEVDGDLEIDALQPTIKQFINPILH